MPPESEDELDEADAEQAIVDATEAFIAEEVEHFSEHHPEREGA